MGRPNRHNMGACTKPESDPRADPREGAKPKGSGSRRSSIPGNKQNANLALFDTNETARRRRESTLPAGYDGNQLTEEMLNGERFKAFKADRKDLAATCTVCDVDFGAFRRKHMCTSCMEVACDECSPHRRDGDLRVCSRCHQTANNQNPTHEVPERLCSSTVFDERVSGI